MVEWEHAICELKPGRLVHDIAQCTSARESPAIVHYDLEPPVVEVGPTPSSRTGAWRDFGDEWGCAGASSNRLRKEVRDVPR